jgi:hypothetical protein
MAFLHFCKWRSLTLAIQFLLTLNGRVRYPPGLHGLGQPKSPFVFRPRAECPLRARVFERRGYGGVDFMRIR